MESNATTPKATIFDKAENYTTTSLELAKLKTMSASAGVLSTLTSRIVVFAVVAIFSLFLNLGVSFWIGKQLGAYYYGFFIMSFIYLILAIALHKNYHKLVKIPIVNVIASSLLKDKKTDLNNNY